MSETLRIVPAHSRELVPARRVAPDVDRRPEVTRASPQAGQPGRGGRGGAPAWMRHPAATWSSGAAPFLAQALGAAPPPSPAAVAASYRSASTLLVQYLGRQPPFDILV